MPAHEGIDQRNAEFWNDVCGFSLASLLGITERDEEGLQRFDAGFLEIYPYLESYLPARLDGVKLLEIGLGYGTLSQLLIDRGADYYGLDIAPEPVQIVSDRLRRRGSAPEGRVVQGSALDIPWPSAFFDRLFTIGCLHHTGDLLQSVSEVNRVLKPGGTAVVMLYNRHGFRQLVQVPAARLRRRLVRTRPSRPFDEIVRGMYDTNEAGEPAPHTDYTTPREARQLFSSFSTVRVDKQNFDMFTFFRGRVVLPRERFLRNIARVVGLDLYITAVK